MSEPLIVELPDPLATAVLGHRLGELLFPGAVVALVGPLGAGKTQLTRAIAEGLGLKDGRAVTSPTFVLIQEYAARLPVYHFDVYRLRSAVEFFDLAAGEYLEGDGVCLIEWGDRVEAYLPPDHLRVTLGVAGETARRARLEATGPRHAAIVESLRGFTPALP
jgi:tRNA threonylcarbamoyladenosine biosynthesis protein TsaE